MLASPSPPRSMLGVAGKRWVTGGLHSRRGDRGLRAAGEAGAGERVVGAAAGLCREEREGVGEKN